MAVRFDINRLFKDLGGPSQVWQKIQATRMCPPGVEPADITVGAVQAWARRGNVPAPWLAVLLTFATAHETPIPYVVIDSDEPVERNPLIGFI